MRRALEQAIRGQGRVEPNPMVGCVVIDDQGVVGQGYHAKFGGPHAEVDALDDARRSGRADRLPGATAYVTLEPCCHHGKTPPCTDALLDAGIRRVVVAMLDPFPEVSGRGVEHLKQAGVQVDVGLLEDQARRLNAPYLKRLQTGLPWVIAKWAMSLDGKIAARTGDSRWISGPASRERVHELRGRVDAIVVGSGTAAADDPMLTARLAHPPHRVARRVVVDSQCSLNLNSRLVQTARQVPTLVWTGTAVDDRTVEQLRSHGVEVQRSDATDRQQWIEHLLRYLVTAYTATNVLVEGGSGLFGALFDADLVDEIHAYIAPLVLGGGAQAPSPVGGKGVARVQEAARWQIETMHRIGEDCFIHALRLADPRSAPSPLSASG
ncbi:MAG: bifunctional diaminohydroxyphosphoribosylaminopyrimidine deaminase/5-amino-6-(5-phosphoribosylamino)uracil reductase RibD [Planctomycetota bacterium]|nr:MAG: bifunctional diaminohydroxyphosphoribosylaminopyrimidine deaminase/5-amino-6-(5-phosphoribosylamino)uracil reductase RibD [Planctomycetota bacterium]